MPAAISETIKPKVISQWLLGLRRDIIAQDNNISAGAVSNIINNWVLLLENLKLMHSGELAKVLNSAGLTPAQCAIGFRTMTLLREQNIDADAAAQLIVDIYKNVKNLKLHQVNLPYL